MTNGFMMTNDIQQVLVSHFQDLFTSILPPSHHLQTLSCYPPIDEDQLHNLALLVSLKEVRDTIFFMGNYKSPGPDGFHLLFFKAKWDIVGPSIFQFVQQALEDPSKIGDINYTLLTLIPKLWTL